MMKRWSSYFLSAILIIGILTGCSTNASSGQKSDNTNKTIKIAYNIWVGSAGVYVADAKHFFEKQGLKVKLVEFASPTEAAQALLANKVDLALTTMDTIVMLKANESKENKLKMISVIDPELFIAAYFLWFRW